MNSDVEQTDTRRVSASVRATIDEYLGSIRSPRKRGRKRTVETVQRELFNVKAELAVPNLDPVNALLLTQRVIDLGDELLRLSAVVDGSELEDRFVEVAKLFADRKGISYEAWRAVGVDPAVLARAGIRR